MNLYQAFANDGISFVDPFGLQSVLDARRRTLYNAIDEFGEDALNASQEDLRKRQAEFDRLPGPQKVVRNRPTQAFEFCGRVCQRCDPKTGKFSFYRTGPVKGLFRGCQTQFTPPCENGDIQVGIYHSHPGDPDGLSGKDTKGAREGVLNPEHPLYQPPMRPIGATWENGDGDRITDIYNPWITPTPQNPHSIWRLINGELQNY